MQYAVLDRTSSFRREHKSIIRQLGLISKKVRDPRASPGASSGHLLDGLGATLRTHFANEEKGLFRPLETKLGRSSPVAEMKEEHRSICRDYALFRSAWEAQEATRGSAGDVEVLLASFEAGLRKHVEKEERVVFWLVDCKLQDF